MSTEPSLYILIEKFELLICLPNRSTDFTNFLLCELSSINEVEPVPDFVMECASHQAVASSQSVLFARVRGVLRATASVWAMCAHAAPGPALDPTTSWLEVPFPSPLLANIEAGLRPFNEI